MKRQTPEYPAPSFIRIEANVIHYRKIGFRTPEPGPRRSRFGCKTSARKGLLALLTISVLALTGPSIAQDSKDGLYAIPDSDPNAAAAQESTANRFAQSSMDSLDPHGARFKSDMERAEACARGGDPRQETRTSGRCRRFEPAGLETAALATGMDRALGRSRAPHFAGRRRVRLVVARSKFHERQDRPPGHDARPRRQTRWR